LFIWLPDPIARMCNITHLFQLFAHELVCLNTAFLPKVMTFDTVY